MRAVVFPYWVTLICRLMPELSLSVVPFDDLNVIQQFIEKGQKPQPAPTPSVATKLKDAVFHIPGVLKFLPAPDPQKELEQELLAQRKAASSFPEWYSTLLKLDELQGKNEWKFTEELDLYDNELVHRHLEDMRAARELGNTKYLLYLIRTRWVRNLGNMGSIALYRHLFVGTKVLIEEYISECQRCLEYLLSSGASQGDLDDRYLLGMLVQTRKNIGRTALVLSGGLTFGIFHLGVLLALTEANLLPRIISGSSAGSIMALILCCHDQADTIEMLKNITLYRFDIFGDLSHPNPEDSKLRNLLNIVSHFLKYGTFFDTLGLKQTMIHFVGDLTFREAYNRTGKILNISVTPGLIHEQLTLLNYLTAPNCLVWLVVCALCLLPGVFPLTTIYEKNLKTGEIQEWNNDLLSKYVDGSVDNDLPISRLSEMFNVDHIIAVQVNPHVAPVLNLSVSSVGGEIENETLYKLKRFLNNAYDFVALEAIHYFQVLSELDIYKNLSNKAIAVLSQQYIGDITIFPEFKPNDFAQVFTNPTPDFMIDFIVRGAKAAWPKLTVINNHCSVEFALDKAIIELRGRIITLALRLLMAPVDLPTHPHHRHSRSTQGIRGISKNKLYQSLLAEGGNVAARDDIKVQDKPSVVRRNTTLLLSTRKRSRSQQPNKGSIVSNSLRSSPLKIRNGSSMTNLARELLRTAYGEADDGYEEYEPPRLMRHSRSLSSMLKLADRLRSNSPHRTTQRIPYLHNPYYEKLEKTFRLHLDLPLPQGLMTMPSSTRLKNLYIGLNRLKDELPLPHPVQDQEAFPRGQSGLKLPANRHSFHDMLLASDDDTLIQPYVGEQGVNGGYDFYGLVDMSQEPSKNLRFKELADTDSTSSTDCVQTKDGDGETTGEDTTVGDEDEEKEEEDDFDDSGEEVGDISESDIPRRVMI